MPSRTEIKIGPQVSAYAAKLHPEHRRAIKAAIRELAQGRGDHKALKNNLQGFHRLRVGRYRIIYELTENGSLECVFIEDRSVVYEEFTPSA
jgi:mRNA interferase RelE/StbE